MPACIHCGAVVNEESYYVRAYSARTGWAECGRWLCEDCFPEGRQTQPNYIHDPWNDACVRCGVTPTEDDQRWWFYAEDYSEHRRWHICPDCLTVEDVFPSSWVAS